MKPVSYVIFLLLLGLSLLFFDFCSKAYVNSLLPFVDEVHGVPFQETSLFQGFLGGVDFSITLAHNQGMALGFFSAFTSLIFVLRILVIFSLLIYLFFFRFHHSLDLPLVLIITGAIGNVIDHLVYGSVVDFLHFRFWGHSFPIFNMADTLITIGVIWLFLLSSFKKTTFFPKETK